MRETGIPPTYIVLDVPSPMAEWIQAMRKRFDEERSRLPAEITLTGSNGIGFLSPGQSLEFIANCLRRAAEQIPPFEAEFGNVDRFENTDIYFLNLIDETPFLRAHEIVANCGLRFEPSPYPYQPHCTLKLRKPPKDLQELLELFLLQAPRHPFRLDLLSLYSLPTPDTCDLIYKVELGSSL